MVVSWGGFSENDDRMMWSVCGGVRNLCVLYSPAPPQAGGCLWCRLVLPYYVPTGRTIRVAICIVIFHQSKADWMLRVEIGVMILRPHGTSGRT